MTKITESILETTIQNLVNAVTTATSVDNVVYTAISVNNAFSDRTNSVNTVNDLPNVFYAKISNGTIYFVEALNLHVVANNNNWLGLDGRVLRLDGPSGVIWSWGINNTGQLGNGTISNTSSPVSVVGGFTDWCQVSAGDSHTSAVRKNGTLWTWGKNNCGKLGDNSITSKSSPVSVVGGFTDWCQVSAGYSHTSAVRKNGTLWTWGGNASGQLGDDSTTSKSSPVSVVGGFTDWCQVSVGSTHTAAIRTNGTLWTWGGNSSMQLGHGTGTTCSRSSPVSVVGGFTDWCQVSAGGSHTLGMRLDGTIWGSGNGYFLGVNSNSLMSSPVSVVGGFTDWCQVSAGQWHSAAIRTNGTLWTWGWNTSGQLGHGTATSCTRLSPVSVVGGFTDWCQVSAGRSHSVAVRTNGTIWTWGNNTAGSLGINTSGYGSEKSSPVSVVGGFNSWVMTAAGNMDSFAVACF